MFPISTRQSAKVTSRNIVPPTASPRASTTPQANPSPRACIAATAVPQAGNDSRGSNRACCVWRRSCGSFAWLAKDATYQSAEDANRA
ncbi:MAG: hypothetical protein EXS41_06795 [Opitutaceae bacterium]|nr:hypothetical protein [Opitutaceae bacterium]